MVVHPSHWEVTPTTYTNYGAAAQANVKATAGTVVSFLVTSIAAATMYFQIHNLAGTVPTGGTPVISYPIPASNGTTFTALVLDSNFLGNGEIYRTGIAVGISTAAGTMAPTGTAGNHNIILKYY